jgi:hypothetical protein
MAGLPRLSGSSIYLGKTGATGGVTGAHGHFEVIKDGKRYGLSQARADLGQNIQFRLPGSQTWQQMYSQGTGGQFQLNPAVALTEGIGIREIHPVTGARNVAHQGEDYSFPEGTSLRFLGGGNVQGLSNVGRAGNISTLHTGPYKLDVFHMSELPKTASAAETNQLPTAPVLPGTPPTTAQQPTQTTEDLLKRMLLQEALAPSKSQDFLTSFLMQNPYLAGGQEQSA